MLHFAALSRLCRGRNIAASIDLLFIDTSHYYEHTVLEIQSWFPLLSPAASHVSRYKHGDRMGRRDGCIQWSLEQSSGVTLR
jgi:hypothetical protein